VLFSGRHGFPPRYYRKVRPQAYRNLLVTIEQQVADGKDGECHARSDIDLFKAITNEQLPQTPKQWRCLSSLWTLVMGSSRMSRLLKIQSDFGVVQQRKHRHCPRAPADTTIRPAGMHRALGHPRATAWNGCAQSLIEEMVEIRTLLRRPCRTSTTILWLWSGVRRTCGNLFACFYFCSVFFCGFVPFSYLPTSPCKSFLYQICCITYQVNKILAVEIPGIRQDNDIVLCWNVLQKKVFRCGNKLGEMHHDWITC
jgi:hypothetical protein